MKMTELLYWTTKSVLVLSLSALPFGIKAAELYRYRVDDNELVFSVADDPKQEAIADDNVRVSKAMQAADSKSILEIQVLADTWAARYYRIPVIVGKGLLKGQSIVPKSFITCVPKPLVHWLIDYPNANGDGQTYHAILLPNGTIVEPQVVDLQKST
jgi:hypothetical protein